MRIINGVTGEKFQAISTWRIVTAWFLALISAGMLATIIWAATTDFRTTYPFVITVGPLAAFAFVVSAYQATMIKKWLESWQKLAREINHSTDIMVKNGKILVSLNGYRIRSKGWVVVKERKMGENGRIFLLWKYSRRADVRGNNAVINASGTTITETDIRIPAIETDLGVLAIVPAASNTYLYIDRPIRVLRGRDWAEIRQNGEAIEIRYSFKDSRRARVEVEYNGTIIDKINLNAIPYLQKIFHTGPKDATLIHFPARTDELPEYIIDESVIKELSKTPTAIGAVTVRLSIDFPNAIDETAETWGKYLLRQ